MDHGLPARRGDAANLLVCASCTGWSPERAQNGTDFLPWAGKSRGKGIAQSFCCHCCMFTSQESGRKSLAGRASAGAAKEAELEDVEEIGDQASSPVETGNFLGIKQQEIRAFTAVSK